MRISDWSSDVCSSDLWPANLQTLTRGAPGCIPGFLRSSRVSMHQASTGEPRMLKEVGGVTVQARHRATCHCGAVELELDLPDGIVDPRRSEEHTSELQSLMRMSCAVFCLKTKQDQYGD